MAKVRYPLRSGDVRGKFGRLAIFTRGGYARRIFIPRDTKTIAQLAVREAFKEYVMAGLTKEQADLLYAAIAHLHDDRYSLLNHGHDHGELGGLGDDDHTQYHNNARGDARYSQLGHDHSYASVYAAHAGNAVVPAGATLYLVPFVYGLVAFNGAIGYPFNGIARYMYFRVGGTQPGTGSLTCTLFKNGVATAKVATVPANGVSGDYANIVDDVSLVAGDRVGWTLQNNAGADSIVVGNVTMGIVSDTF
jgi:hypothetical protein